MEQEIIEFVREWFGSANWKIEGFSSELEYIKDELKSDRDRMESQSKLIVNQARLRLDCQDRIP